MVRSRVSKLIAAATVFLFPLAVRAQEAIKRLENIGAQTGFSNTKTPQEIVGSIIYSVTGLGGIIFLILLVYAGFTYMTAGGDEEKITRAKKTITRSIIGLAIFVSAFAISVFVVNSLVTATTGGGGGEVTTGCYPPCDSTHTCVINECVPIR